MSLYFTWDHPQLYVLDRETFLDDMIAGDLDSQYCSPFLVNVILARACVSRTFTVEERLRMHRQSR